MLWSILSGAVAVVVVQWIVFRISNRRVIRLCSAVPCAQPYYPILGNALIFVGSLGKMTERGMKVVEESVLKGHRAFCFWIGPYPITIVTNPDDIKVILNNSLSRGKEIEESSRACMKNGLILSPVDHWKVTRRHLESSFHPHNLEQLIPAFNLTSRQLVDELLEHVDGPVFNLMPHAMSASLKAVCIFLYGQENMKNISPEWFNSLKHSVELAAELMALRVSRPWLNIGIVFKSLLGKELNTVKRGTRMILEITNSVKRELSTEKLNGDSDHRKGNTQQRFQTILEAMCELQKRVSSITDKDILDEMSSFFATGTDTMAASVSSCFLALARFPHIQDKVYEEICSVLPEDHEEDITHLDLKRLTYLDQVIKETLRFFTVVPFTGRSSNRDIDLVGYTIPANKLTVLWLASVCFDPNYYPDPYKFDPDRFSTPSSSDDVFIPFSRGPRNCIGKGYALLLMKVMVVHVLRNYKLSTNMDILNLKKTFMMTLTCSDGYNVSLVKRNS